MGLIPLANEHDNRLVGWRAGHFNKVARHINDAQREAMRPPVPLRQLVSKPTTMLVKNSSGSTVDRFGVLGLDDPIFTFTDNEKQNITLPNLEGDTPDATDGEHIGNFGVLLQPLKDGETGRAAISGLFACQINGE